MAKTKFLDDQKIRGVKHPAAERCNRNHPKSTHQRRARRQAEAIERQARYDELTLEEKITKMGKTPGDHTRQMKKFIHQGVSEGKLALASKVSE